MVRLVRFHFSYLHNALCWSCRRRPWFFGLPLLFLAASAHVLLAVGIANAAKVEMPAPALPRVVSLDVCADQYVLALAEREQIAALSPQVQSEFSRFGLMAHGIPRVRPSAEAVIMLTPDLVVRQWGGGLGAAELFERAGIPVFGVGLAEDVENIRAAVLELGAALKQPERARRLADEMDRQVRTLENRPDAARPVALYVTGSGATAGRGTLIDEILSLAGVTNQVADRQHTGWQSINLEKIALAPPDLFVTAFLGRPGTWLDTWTMVRHPFFARMLGETPTVDLPGDLVACPAWFILDAAEKVARLRQSLGSTTADGTALPAMRSNPAVAVRPTAAKAIR